MKTRWYIVETALIASTLLGCEADKPLHAMPIASASPPVTPTASRAALPAVVPPAASGSSAVAAKGRTTCPEGMVKIEGGQFRMGAPYSVSPKSDYYLHDVALRSFCLDTTEVTVAAYRACVDHGGCATPHSNNFSCTWELEGKDDHPINCLDFPQAEQACKAMGKRLPTEEEWEYAARGGKEQRTYSWGEQAPSKKYSCYNNPGTCPVRAHPAGAFGLYGMTGNVWEWTASPFVKHAGWTPIGQWRVYRGGSYSRRFPRWMKTWVRNRFHPEEWGAHLGIRCADDLADTKCPEGTTVVADDPTRCLLPGEIIPKPPTAVASGPPVDNAPPPVMSRSPSFDADCRQYKPSTPVAYSIVGSSFAQRQSLKKSRGCSNRDVGPNSNSVCCPN